MSVVLCGFMVSLLLWCFLGVLLASLFSKSGVGLWAFREGKMASFFLKVCSLFGFLSMVMFLSGGGV